MGTDPVPSQRREPGRIGRSDDAGGDEAAHREKARQWTESADEIADDDPATYAIAPGQGRRPDGNGLMALIGAAFVDLFRLVADVFLLAGLVMLRLLVMFLPAAAVIGVFAPCRESSNRWQTSAEPPSSTSSRSRRPRSSTPPPLGDAQRGGRRRYGHHGPLSASSSRSQRSSSWRHCCRSPGSSATPAGGCGAIVSAASYALCRDPAGRQRRHQAGHGGRGGEGACCDGPRGGRWASARRCDASGRDLLANRVVWDVTSDGGLDPGHRRARFTPRARGVEPSRTASSSGPLVGSRPAPHVPSGDNVTREGCPTSKRTGARCPTACSVAEWAPRRSRETESSRVACFGTHSIAFDP